MKRSKQKALDGISKEELATILSEEGFPCTVKDELLESAVAGLRFAVFFPGPTETKRASAIQFFAGFQMNETPTVLVDKANRWNREHKFPKVFVDEDGNMIATMDVLVRAASSEQIKDYLRFWGMALGQFHMSS